MCNHFWKQNMHRVVTKKSLSDGELGERMALQPEVVKYCIWRQGQKPLCQAQNEMTRMKSNFEFSALFKTASLEITD